MNEIVKKSIFKQSDYVKVYEPELVWRNVEYIVGSKRHHLGENFKLEFVQTKTIYEIDIPQPVLKVGEKFYFESDEKVVTIKSVIRTDLDNVVYFVEDNIVIDYESKRNVENLIESNLYKTLMPTDEYDGLKQKYNALLEKVKINNKKLFASKIKLD